MDLDPQIAENIVSSLKDIIHYEINLFDSTGTIIASTDRSRIGTSHGGARLAISTQDVVTIDSEHQFEGAKNGINLPVLFNNSVVAVIGITGERREVEPFGNVIRKMTEILIRENWRQISRFDQRERLSNLVNTLTVRQHDTDFASYLASVLRIDLSRKRLAVVGLLSVPSGKTPSDESLYDSLALRMQTLTQSFFSIFAQRIVLFIDENERHSLSTLLPGIKSDVSLRLRQNVVFGIGTVQTASWDYWRSYEEASRAADWLLFTEEGPVKDFEDLDYGIFFSSIPDKEIAQFEEHVFKGLSEQEISSFQKTFDAYTGNNGSIIHGAEELFLHKNTFQNRLNRIKERTGYNPRNLSEYAVLSFAFKLRDYRRYRRNESPPPAS